jgi:probable F420-dependent oxidoreductase
MRFSVCLPTGFEGVMHPIPFVQPEDFVRLAKKCEALGYHSVWGNDHINSQRYVRELFPGQPPNFYELFTTLSFMAAVTTTLRFGTAVCVVPMRDPLWIAKQASTFDQLSGGRLMLGVGIGAYREEFESWAPRIRKEAQRGEMLDEGMAAIRAFFSERVVTFSGTYYAYADLEMAPKPKQDPFPIYYGGHNLAAIERAARWGAGWLPGWRPWPELKERIDRLRDRCEELGRPRQAVEVAPEFGVTIAKTAEQAEAIHLASGLVAHRESLNYTGRDLSQQVTANLVGSPESILEKVDGLKRLGVDHCCALMFPTNTMTEYEEQIEWFAKTVMPGGVAPG